MKKLENNKSYKYLPSPISSHVISPRISKQNDQMTKDLTVYNKFVSFLSNQHVQLIRKKLLEFRGTHNPINYQNEFNFQQRWQKIFKSSQQANFNSFISSNKFSYLISFFVMIQNFILVWLLSAFRLYQIRDQQPFFQVGIIFIIGDLFKKIYFYWDHYKSNTQVIKLQKILLNSQFLIQIFSDLWCFIYYVCFLAKTQISNVDNSSMLIFDLITIVILAKRAYQIYNSFVILVIASKYKNQMTIVDLVIKMIIILHFFSIILYGVAMFSPESNWLTRLELQDNAWDTRYIYTLYFACTTMFTVGYGDILPTNKVQIITIMFIQALGMAVFGYIVNQMGGTLRNMRKKRANLQKDIYNAQRISSQYDLKSDLGKKVRDYVVSNQIAQQELAINQQNDFLLKLNEDLRNEVKQSHQLKIIKTSIFFVSHWSKKIQIQMAKKLQKCIFAPNENLHTKNQVDRLFIMVKGKIQVYTQKTYGTKVCCRKLLKTIQKLPGQEVFRNVYGFTSFFSGRGNRLRAVAKQSTICYTLGYENMKDSINEDSNDFQYFHELRQVFQFSKVPQKWQTPNIVNIRQNFNPVIYFVIKKHTKLSQAQKRHKSYHRRDYFHKLICQQIAKSGSVPNQSFYAQSYDEQSSLTSSQLNQTQIHCQVTDYLMQQDNNNPNKTLKSIKENQSNKSDQLIVPNGPSVSQQINQACLFMIKNSAQLISNRSYWRKHYYNSKQQRYEQKAKAFLQQHIELTSQFQLGKNYNRFFPKFNKKLIIDKVQKKPQFMRKSFGLSSKKLYKSGRSIPALRKDFSKTFGCEKYDF